MTATQANDMMNDRKTAIDGLLSRISFITTSETTQNHSASLNDWQISKDMFSRLKILSERTLLNMGRCKKENQNILAVNPDGRANKIFIKREKAIGISDQAWAYAKQLENDLRKETMEHEENGQTVMASLVGRLYEKSMRVASLIASYECALLPENEWEICVDHIKWAVMWERSHIDSLKDIATIAAEENDHAKLKKSILMAIDSIPPEKRINEYWVTHSDMRQTNKGSLRKAKPYEIAQALIDLEDARMIETQITEEIKGKKVKRMRRVL
jgi:hypothetical protein